MASNHPETLPLPESQCGPTVLFIVAKAAL